LFVDEIVEMTDDRIVTRKKIDAAEPFFKGHYPGTPIMPGVLLCEAIFQSGAILISKLITDKAAGGELDGVPVLTRITGARFKNMVRPGDTIDIESSIKEVLSNVYYMKGSASVAGKKAVMVEYACCLAKAPKEA
jgi:3-hydroxyacyl-[acyl-carrier-protein] dehydratase